MPPPQLQSAPQEDISVVMGRFHAWDTARQKAPAPHAAADGVRELSYEEALAYSHPKRPIRNPLPAMPRAASEQAVEGAGAQTPANPVPSPVVAGQQMSKSANEASTAVPGKTASGSSATKTTKSGTKPAVLARRKAAAVAVTPPGTMKPASKAALNTSVGSRKATLSRKPSAKALPAATIVSTKKPRVQAAKAIEDPAALPVCAPTATAKTVAKNIKSKQRSRPATSREQSNIEARRSTTFQGALAKCLKESPRRRASVDKASSSKSSLSTPRARAKVSAKAEETIPRKPVESIARTISVNLRLSKAEHDRMRRGAAEADLSLATFIRESTLRYQIARERDQKSTQDPRSGPTPNWIAETFDNEAFDRPVVETAGPSLLTRMKNFWLGKRLTAIA